MRILLFVAALLSAQPIFAAPRCEEQIAAAVEADGEARGIGPFGFAVQYGDGRPAASGAPGRFPQQSVYKLPIAIAALHAAERGRLDLGRRVTLTRSDISFGHSPMAADLERGHVQLTAAELIARSLETSDNTAADAVLRLAGGPRAVQAFLRRRGYDIRVDRSERAIQTAYLGLDPADPRLAPGATMAGIAAARSPENEARGVAAYLTDPRDTATPLAHVRLLADLKRGKLLSPANTQRVFAHMRATTTTTDRLKAGIPPGWTIAQRGGTGGAQGGVSTTFNNIGLIEDPRGRWVAVSLLARQSRLPRPALARFFADTAARVTAADCWSERR